MKKNLKQVKYIHLIGIGGIGMSGLALLLHEKGYCLTGSDLKVNDSVELLRSKGIPVAIGHSAGNLSEIVDLVGYSSAIPSHNQELVCARKNQIATLCRGELLGLLSWDARTVAVAGSHGKTTTSSLIGYLLSQLGYQPTVFVGGIPLNYAQNAWWGKDYFVIETDESDGSFLYYNPRVSIITTIDHEHLDFYHTFERLYKSFEQFVYQTKEKAIGCGDFPLVRELIDNVKGVTYGFLESNAVRGVIKGCAPSGCSFDVVIKEDVVASVLSPLIGNHNVLNTLAAFAFFFSQGHDLTQVAEALRDFKGTKRRFQIKGKVGGVTFIDDYAHHPTEISAVLQGAQSLGFRRIVVLFQPHRFTRVRALADSFASCFTGVDHLIVTDIYAASEEPLEGVTSGMLFDKIKKHFSGTIHYIPRDEIAAVVPGLLAEGDLLLGVGAGDVNLLLDEVMNEFKKAGLKTSC